MNLSELKNEAESIIKNFRSGAKLPRENNIIDYKSGLHIFLKLGALENFLINLGRDIISFANSDGGILFIGFEEKKDKSIIEKGIDQEVIELLDNIDLGELEQKITKICKSTTGMELCSFDIGTKKFCYFLIEKSSDVLIPIKNSIEYENGKGKKCFELKSGEVLFRVSGKNEKANKGTSEFNRFIQIKANEKSKEFMQIWSNLLPEMVDINPKEVLILNPAQNKVYGFNSHDYTLSGSDIEIGNEDGNIFNIILDTIKSGDIGKITNDEGKPIYKIVGEKSVKGKSDHISLTTLTNEVQKNIKYNISQGHIKQVCYSLQWVTTKKFGIQIKDEKDVLNINTFHEKYIWIEIEDSIKNKRKVVFSRDAVEVVVEKINDSKNHQKMFQKELIEIDNNDL